MNNTQILKIMDLLNTNQLDEIRAILTQELLKENKQPTKAKVFSTIKKFIEDKELKSRPVLQTIMHKNNKQFICNGYELYIFDTYKEELNALPQTSEEETQLDYSKIANFNLPTEELTEEHKFILTHLKEYINYYKATQEDKKNITIYFDGKFWNAKVLENFVNINANDFDTMQRLTGERTDSFIAKTNDITSMILAIRINNTEEQQKYIKIMEDFKKQIENA